MPRPPSKSFLDHALPHARDLVPFALRVELTRLRRMPAFLLESPRMARRGSPTDPSAEAFAVRLAAHATPLRRSSSPIDERLQSGKEHNVALAARRLDGVVVRPGQMFSYHHVVGRPSRSGGFVLGLELHDGRPRAGVGGGACQVANLLYVLAVRGLMVVTERHRHSLDLFPDDGRSVPFGCGATVFYNQADLRFVNPLADPVRLHLEVAGGELRGELATPRDPGVRASIVETDHRFVRDGSAIFRENTLFRRITRVSDGALVDEHLLAAHRARVCYPVPGALVTYGAASGAGPDARPRAVT